jgi:hypothetical protein
MRFLRHGSGVQWLKTRPLKRSGFRGPMRHWHTVGPDIPCQVARLQSLTPLLQAKVHCSLVKDVAQPSSK